MFKPLPIAAWALVAGMICNSPAMAQTEEITKQLEQKLKALRLKASADDELKKAEAELQKAKAQLDKLAKEQKEKESKGKQAEPVKPVPPTPPNPKGGANEPVWKQSPEQLRKAVEELTLSKDPKVAAAAKELLAQLPKPPAPPATKPGGGELKLELKAEPKKGEIKIEGMVLVMNVGGFESSLKMSADGKKAALIGTDGSVTIYDVTTGKELMKFPAKK
jgi:hypothetical protein